MQARARGALVRRRGADRSAKLRRFATTMLPLFQARIRGQQARRTHRDQADEFRIAHLAVVGAQAAIRARLTRARHERLTSSLRASERLFIRFQAVARGALVRSVQEQRIQDLGAATLDVIGLQAQIRGALARRSQQARQASIRAVESNVIDLQARLRGCLARRRASHLRNALRRVDVSKSVNTLQTLCRGALARKRVTEQRKEFEFVAPDVVGLQAVIRGALARARYLYHRDVIHHESTLPVIVELQSLIRGLLARRRFFDKLIHYHHHLEKVVKVQSVVRAQQQAKQYKQLTRGRNVPVSTIKNFVHLLRDSDVDFQEDIALDNLRKEVVERIRENQRLEANANALELKMALLIKNKITLDEVDRERRLGSLAQRGGTLGLAHRDRVLADANDPFALKALDSATQRKLEAYQELFYLLQTRPEYLACLFRELGRVEMTDRARKNMEATVLTMYGYAQETREEFLLLKLFQVSHLTDCAELVLNVWPQRCIGIELETVDSLQDYVRQSFPFFRLVVQYGRGDKERKYLRATLGPLVEAVRKQNRSFEVNPLEVRLGTSILVNAVFTSM